MLSTHQEKRDLRLPHKSPELGSALILSQENKKRKHKTSRHTDDYAKISLTLSRTCLLREGFR